MAGKLVYRVAGDGPEDRFVPGDLIGYREDNQTCLVAVLENKSGGESIAYRLKILRSMNPHFIMGNAREGAEFDMMRKRSGGWVFMAQVGSVSEYGLEKVAQEFVGKEVLVER